MKSFNFRVFAIAVMAATSTLLSPQAAYGKTVNIGNGSGNLSYPTAQTTLGLQPGDTVYIVAGTYSGLSLGNIAGTAAAPITITCDPNAVFSTTTAGYSNNMINVTFVNFVNFRYESYASRVMQFSGSSHDLLFKNFHLASIGDWGFRIYDATKVFDGTKASTFYNFKWDGCHVDGSIGGVITNNDYQAVSNLTSLFLDFEVVGCTFTNIGGGTLEMTKCFNLKVHDCTFSYVTSPNHIACVYLSGYASVYRNNFNHHWGDDVRAYAMKLNALGYNGSDAVVRYYDNLSWEKTKYAAFEQQVIPQADLNASQGYFSTTACEICFNTYYRSRKADWKAPLVDIYGGNDLVIKHNLVIEPECDATYNPNQNYVYSFTSAQPTSLAVDNNLTYGTFAASGLVDAVQFAPSATSPVRNASNGTISYIMTDHFNHARYVGNADVGAVELQIPGDFNGDGYVDQADYTVWADNYSADGSVLAVGSRGTNTGAVNQADYTTWADHYGQGTPPAITVSQPDEPAVQAAPTVTPAASSPAATKNARQQATEALRLKQAAARLRSMRAAR